MNCLFLFKSKKPKTRNQNKDKRKGKEIAQNSAPELRNQSETLSFNLQTPRSLPSPRSIRDLYTERENNLRVFTYEELSEATCGFSRKLKIGEGGFGSVYKGKIPTSGDSDSPLVVAIKKLNQQGLQGHKQWLAEVQFLGVVNHQNVVKLLGYCSDDGERGIERLLVYEFMSNRSLEDHLFTRGSYTLPWKQRLEIILGAAEGLAYLHEIQVIYRDFKSSNVLLNDEFCPKLSDFGLAREGPQGDNTHVTTARVGTHGYAAPEYVQTGHLRMKSDVYSFGVVLYEIITGRRTIERSKPAAEQRLLEWIKEYPADSQRFNMIVDSRLRNNYPAAGVRSLAKLADLCLKKNDKERPSMEIVVERLKKIIEESNSEYYSMSGTKESSQVRSKSRVGGPVKGSSRGGVSVRG
ncbi:putative receptor-like protein kinase [Raphanus sativus]|uniref:non-specific serine/threonine protein kinase n=1 Tax=Raphanus sativus TaxID=3726 RepID=A0A9W3DPY5_RAPSA|nr:probable serine/threonine-protein kinase PBL19 [Raphanus sativus]KAJ4901432.1 putative receptor-like protein kinase [Raphanus sativus]